MGQSWTSLRTMMAYSVATNRREAVASAKLRLGSTETLKWYRLDDGVMGGRSSTQHTTEGGALKGIFTPNDVLRRVVAAGLDPDATPLSAARPPARFDRRRGVFLPAGVARVGVVCRRVRSIVRSIDRSMDRRASVRSVGHRSTRPVVCIRMGIPVSYTHLTLPTKA